MSKNNLTQLHKNCMNEIQQLHLNLTNYLMTATRAHNVLTSLLKTNQGDVTTFNDVYDKFVFSIVNVTGIAHKFNATICKNDLESSFGQYYRGIKKTDAGSSMAQSAAVPNKNDKVNTANNDTSNKTNSRLNVKTNKIKLTPKDTSHSVSSKFPMKFSDVLKDQQEIFNSDDLSDFAQTLNSTNFGYKYLKKDREMYKMNCTIAGSVTYIKDLNSLLFFIVDVNDPNAKKLNIENPLELRQYFDLPPENEIFGLVSHGFIVRAIRKSTFKYMNSDVSSKYISDALLIDFGEIIKINIDTKMYRLLPEYKKIPAQAMLCKLVAIEDRNANQFDLTTRLSSTLYNLQNFILNDNDDELLYVSLIETVEENISPPLSKLNPFLDDFINENELRTEATTTEDSRVINDQHDTNSTLNTTNRLTDAQRQILFDDKPCTTNALEAIYGYIPKDDKRICKFYNPQTGGCFKGINCKKDHIQINNSCWTKDVLPDATTTSRELDVLFFKTNTIINITPTHVSKLNCFYAQINTKHFVAQVWQADNVRKWQTNEKSPDLHSLVLAKFDDDLYYRAKVFNYDESRGIFDVIFVDFGNQQKCVLENLAHCTKTMMETPYQAELIYINDIEEMPHDDDELIFLKGRQMLCDQIINETFDVIVHSHIEDLRIEFIDNEYKQTIQNMIDLGCIRRISENL